MYATPSIIYPCVLENTKMFETLGHIIQGVGRKQKETNLKCNIVTWGHGNDAQKRDGKGLHQKVEIRTHLEE